MEFTFFTLACMVVCFVFVTKAVWVMHLCFHYFWSMLAYHQGISSFHSALAPQVGFVWGGVNFLHRKCYCAVFDKNSADNTLVSYLLLNTVYKTWRHFPFFSQASRLGLSKKLGWGHGCDINPNWVKGYSMPHDIVVRNKICRKE